MFEKPYYGREEFSISEGHVYRWSDTLSKPNILANLVLQETGLVKVLWL